MASRQTHVVFCAMDGIPHMPVVGVIVNVGRPDGSVERLDVSADRAVSEAAVVGKDIYRMKYEVVI